MATFPRLHLSELFLGFTDGEEEARTLDFGKLFVDSENWIDQALQPKIYYILGRKGCGKTVLGYRLQGLTGHDWHIGRQSLADMTSTVAQYDPKKDYLLIFKCAILLEFSRLLLSDTTMADRQEYKALASALEGYFEKEKQPFSMLRKVLRGISLEAGPLQIDLGAYLEGSSQNGDNLQKLEALVGTLLKTSSAFGRKYILLIDDIDNHINFYSGGRELLQHLVYATYYLNSAIRDANAKSKAMLLFRTEVFYAIRDHNYNKLNDDHTLTLSWSNESLESSMLFDLIAHKIKVRNSKLQAFETTDIVKNIFVHEVTHSSRGVQRNTETSKFVLRHTFYRPRDIVKYLSIGQQKFPNQTIFDSYVLAMCREGFSKWLKAEVESEMYINYNSVEVKKFFDIIMIMRSREFGYKKLCELSRKYSIATDEQVHKALQILYYYNVLAQKVTNDEGEIKLLFAGNYNFERSESPDFLTTVFTIHQGLVPALVHRSPERE